MDIRLDREIKLYGRFSDSMKGPFNSQGCLRYHPSRGIELELYNSPWSSWKFLANNASAYAKMYGMVDERPITLMQCIITDGTNDHQMFHVTQALIGFHTEDLESLQVTKYSIGLSSIAEWMCGRPIVVKDDNTESKNGIRAEFIKPPAIIVEVPSRDFCLSVNAYWHSKVRYQSCCIDWDAGLSIAFSQKQSMALAREYMWQVHNLYSLLIGGQLSVRFADIACGIQDGKPCGPFGSILFSQRGQPDCQKYDRRLMPFSYETIRDEFPMLVNNWMAQSRQSVLATDILSDCWMDKSSTVNVRFLRSVRAVEAYHRAKKKECKLGPRLKQMLGIVPGSIQHSITDGDADRFVKKVVDTRNYCTHGDAAIEGRIFGPREMSIAAERIQWLMIVCVWIDLGVGHNKVLDAVQRSQEYMWWVNQHLF